MKKFLGILLTLSIICSLIIVPATTVSAAEEVLFEEVENITAFDYTDLSGIENEEFNAANIQSGDGSIVMTRTSNKGTVAIEKIDNTTIKAVNTMDSTIGSSKLEFIPDVPRTDAAKSVLTFKFKPLYVNANGEKEYCKNPNASSYIRFLAIGKNADGTKKYHRSVQWATGTQYDIDATAANNDGKYVEVTDKTTNIGYVEPSLSRGTSAGASGYSEASQPKLGDDGYYHIKLVSYENTSGQQFSYAYDLVNGEKSLGYHRYDSGNTNHADELGYGYRFEFSTSSKDHSLVLSAEFKDVQMYYEYNAIGKVTTSGMNTSLDPLTGEYTIRNALKSGSEVYTKFGSSYTLDTGYVVNDFSIKVDNTIIHEAVSGGSITTYIKTSGNNAAFGIAPLNKTAGAFQTKAFCYNVVTNGQSTAPTTNTLVVGQDGFAKLRVVATCSEESGTWSYALYDRNGANGVDKPILIKSSTETTYSGLLVGYSISQVASRDPSANDPKVPKLERYTTVKDLHMYSTDNYKDYGYKASGRYHNGSTVVSSSGLKDNGDGTIRYDAMIYVQTNSKGKAIVALYDKEGYEIGKSEKILGNGLYEFTAATPWNITVDDSSAVDTAKLFVYNGSEWITSDGEYKDSRVTFADSKAEYGWANEGDANKTLRFIFTPSFSNLLTPDGFGAYIIPNDWWLKDSTLGGEGGLIASSVGVEPAMTIDSGEEYAIDLGGIPEKEESSEMVAIPFIILDGEYVYGDIFKTKIIDALVEGSAQ